MKKILLSFAAFSALSVTGANASNSSEIKELKASMAEMNAKIAKLEKQDAETKELAEKYKKATPVYAKTSKLKFSGRHYLGFTSLEQNKDAVPMFGVPAQSERYNYFSTRRNYLQVKGYFFEDPKSYMRVTLDTRQIGQGVVNSGDWEVRLKYAYLYINDILPFTGVEFGQAHRPWIDYEEHHGWWYRSIAKTFAESKGDADFTNSADLGINFKTKTEYFSSELGVFNGEGYHGVIDKDENNGLSYEWRLTANLLGTGKEHVHKSDNYADLSFYGQYNNDYSKKGDPGTGDFIWYGVNAVYNQAEFLLAANYLKSTEAGINYKGDGYSVNGELRLLTFSEDLSAWNLLGRYDKWNLDAYEKSRKSYIAGIAYTWNKNVEFIVNYANDKDPRFITGENDDGETELTHQPMESKYLMFTADVKW